MQREKASLVSPPGGGLQDEGFHEEEQTLALTYSQPKCRGERFNGLSNGQAGKWRGVQ